MRVKFIAAGILAIAILTAGTAKNVYAEGKDVETMRPTAPVVDYTPLATALEQSGLSYQKVKDGNWVIPLETKDKQKYQMYITANQDILSFYATIGPLKDKAAPELDKKLAELNESYFIIKFLYNKTSLYIRIDTLLDGIGAKNIMKYAYVMNATIEKELPGLATYVKPAEDDNKNTPKGQK